MKRMFLAIAAAVLVTACSTNRSTVNAQAEGLQGRWALTLFTPGGKEFAELFGQRRPELQFNTSEQRVTGTTGCNQLSGSYTASGSNLQFGSNMVLTKMACPSYDENHFLGAMSSINRFIIRSDQLQLLQDSTVVMVFTKMK